MAWYPTLGETLLVRDRRRKRPWAGRAVPLADGTALRITHLRERLDNIHASWCVMTADLVILDDASEGETITITGYLSAGGTHFAFELPGWLVPASEPG
jgi:hypothetical protein